MLWWDSYNLGLHLSEDQIDDAALGRADEQVFTHLLICELCLKRLLQMAALITTLRLAVEGSAPEPLH